MEPFKSETVHKIIIGTPIPKWIKLLIGVAFVATLSVVIMLLVTSCNNKGENNNSNNGLLIGMSKNEFYLNKMKEKKFLLEKNGPCEDLLEDNNYKLYSVYFDSKTFSDTNAIVEFKFAAACCQEFLGDYLIENDTLKFKFEQVNDELCGCLCWYKFKLTINEPKIKYKDIKINKKGL